MAKLIQEFEFELTSPISIHKGGDLVPVKKLLLKAPSNMHRYYLIKLKQGFYSAMLSMQKFSSGKSQDENLNGPKKEAKLDGKTILMAFLASDIDLIEYFNLFRDFLCNDLCLVDGTIKLTSHMFDQISIEDSEELLGKYIESFLLSSWMKLLNQE